MSLVSCADGRKWQRFWQCIFLLTGVITQCQGANILSVMSVPSKSHMVFLSPLLHELAQRGHNLTVISPFPQSPPVKNIRDIKLNVTMDSFRKERNMSLFEMGEVNPFILLLFSSTIGSSMCKNAISTPEVQDLITSNNQKFDLLIAGVFTECFLGLAHKHNASIIQQIPNTLAFVMGDAVGNPAAYAYIPDIMLDIPVNMNFLQRTLNSMYGLLVELLRFFVYVPNQQEIMVSYSKNIDNLPSVEKLFKSSSLVLINNHESIGLSRPLTPNTIQVGGMHIKPAKDLPKDLKTILDNSKEGVIFFSLGTNVQASEMPNDKFIAFMKAFSKLKQEVLWKWDQDTMVGKPNNVHLGKWFPQNDILGHKNVVLFISHGGLLSLQEAVYHGVPVVGIPLFGDQKVNLIRAEDKGYAVKLLFHNVTEESLLWAINEVLTQQKYRQRAAELSQLFHDQPQQPLERAIFWTEYVLRHGGATHLRSAALDLYWWQLALLDVAAAVAVCTLVPVLLCLFVVRRCRRRHATPEVRAESKKKR
ncbi:UDP-glucosyltransferase 2-like isoform X1 [Schistocerca serialis cubense]|uniref:UDP-glucosyltransferase 2-like isoform X1 n=1 Tax=Schistocerca serialis cubense TaxID=2023355 RepID=UPI00214F4F33|nr:UDP-glucosyltransferase 2-like isoform X1 [Schistocerca serialis cubense]